MNTRFSVNSLFVSLFSARCICFESFFTVSLVLCMWLPRPCSTLQRSFQPVGGALIALSVLMFLTLIGSCFVSNIGRKQMLARITELAKIPGGVGQRGSSKAAAPYANMA